MMAGRMENEVAKYSAAGTPPSPHASPAAL
jgi:hypothetical protein